MHFLQISHMVSVGSSVIKEFTKFSCKFSRMIFSILGKGRGINEKCSVVGKAYRIQESLVWVLSLLPVSLLSNKSVNLSRLQLSPASNENVGLDRHFPTCTSEQKSTHLSSKCGLYLKYCITCILVF